MEKSIEETIKDLKNILLDKNYHRMNFSSVKGYLGELYVKQLLEAEGLYVIHKGNQSGYDLEISPSIKIDVKFSTVKDFENHKDWSWALNSKNKKTVTCTHFACVGVDENFNLQTICIINKHNLEEFPAADGRFKTVQRSFSLLLEGYIYPSSEYFTTCLKLKQNKTVIIVKPQDSLKDKFGI